MPSTKKQTKKQGKKPAKKPAKKSAKKQGKKTIQSRLTKKMSASLYQSLISQKQKGSLTTSQESRLRRELFVNYCKCLKTLRYNPSIKPGLEYPLCNSSIYTKRGFTVPRGIAKRCKRYK